MKNMWYMIRSGCAGSPTNRVNNCVENPVNKVSKAGSATIGGPEARPPRGRFSTDFLTQ